MLAAGLVGAVIATVLDARRLKRIEKLIADGQLIDPESGDGIVAFTGRVGWELAVS